MNAPLLVELFTEELPPKALKQLSNAFGEGIFSGLAKAQLVQRDPRLIQVFATPRRLAVLISDVPEKSADRTEVRKLMPSKVAYNADGSPTAALTKRLEKEGATADQLERRLDGNQETVFLNQVLPGVRLAPWLQQVLQDTISKLPIPKVMSYQLPDSTETVKFVRPAHGLLALHGTEVVDVSVLGLKAGRITHGHRFLGARDIELKCTDEYEARLKDEGKVIAGFEVRRAEIDAQLKARASELGCTLGEYETLLDEVTALVEWPVVYVASFDVEFLEVPQECLILTMRTNQKYFPLFDKSDKLTEKFLVVSNMQVADPKNIIEGNQRVVRPRLADARFFYEQDRKARLETRVPGLAKVVYHNKLGSQLERVERIQLLAGRIARLIGTDPLLAERAAWLAKADLLTGMVGEFPELQGIMGRYYAQYDGEPAEVADAIAEHYLPRHSGDNLPQGHIACALAIADRLDTLAGLFGIGQVPTGEKDPFGLRRAALGVLRILIERAYPLSLIDLIDAAFAGFGGRIGGANTDLQSFIFDRLSGWLRERGFSAHEVESVICLGSPRIDLVLPQLEAVRAFLALPEAESLAAANKRVANILRQAAAKGESFSDTDAANFKESAERTLFDALQTVSGRAQALFSKGDFTGYLMTFAALKSPVDAFFDSVMVMVDETDVRRNRLALLSDLRTAMNRVADISKLAA